MSLTDQAEMAEMFQKPTLKKHKPNFIGDKEICDYSTGHCTNTTACQDCMVYISVMEKRDYEAHLKGD